MSRSLFFFSLVAAIATLGISAALADSIIVANPSFEADGTLANPGYGPITSWSFAGTGAQGVNNASQPFADNGSIPDQGHVAFIQGTGTLSQTIAGLDTTKQYWLQAWTNSRFQGGGGGYPDISAKYNGVTLFPSTNVPSVGGSNPYYFGNVAFTPTAASGALELIAVNPGAPDPSALVDAVVVIQRDADEVVIKNPSFEASGVTSGIGQFAPIAGWTASGGGAGVNNASQPFAAGTTIPDGNNVALQQVTGSLSQTIDNLSVGQQYELTFFYNARLGTENLTLTATIGALTALNTIVTPATNYTLATYPFVATNSSMALTFASAVGTGPGNDFTLLLDNVSIRLIPEPSGMTLLACGGAFVGFIKRRRNN